VVRVMYLLRMAEITSGSSFEPDNPTEQKLGYVSYRVWKWPWKENLDLKELIKAIFLFLRVLGCSCTCTGVFLTSYYWVHPFWICAHDLIGEGTRYGYVAPWLRHCH